MARNGKAIRMRSARKEAGLVICKKEGSQIHAPVGLDAGQRVPRKKLAASGLIVIPAPSGVNEDLRIQPPIIPGNHYGFCHSVWAVSHFVNAYAAFGSLGSGLTSFSSGPYKALLERSMPIFRTMLNRSLSASLISSAP